MQAVFSPSLRILTVEDDPVVRQTLAGWLEDSGHVVYEAADGISGLEQARQRRPDVTLLDLGIPGLSGEKLLQTLVTEFPEMPVIIVSGRSEISDAIAAFKTGAWDYITKPIPSLDMLDLTIRNCVERRDLRLRLALAESRYRELVHHLPMLVFSLDAKLELVFINAASQSILGWEVQETLDTPGWFINNIHPDDRADVLLALQTSLTSGETPYITSFRFMHRNGYPVLMQARTSTVAATSPETGLPVRIEGVLVDMTERVFLEKLLVQREQLNTMGAIADEVAHEFRNPVFALAGFARSLKRRYPDAQEADVILAEAQRLEQLVTKVQDCLTPIPVTPRPSSLDAIISFCVDIMRPVASRKGLALHYDALPDLPNVHSDPDMLAQVVLGMVSAGLDMAQPGQWLRLVLEQAQGVQQITVTLPFTGIAPSPINIFPSATNTSLAQPLAVSHRIARDLGCLLSVRKDGDVLQLSLSVPPETSAITKDNCPQQKTSLTQ